MSRHHSRRILRLASFVLVCLGTLAAPSRASADNHDSPLLGSSLDTSSLAATLSSHKSLCGGGSNLYGKIEIILGQDSNVRQLDRFSSRQADIAQIDRNNSATFEQLDSLAKAQFCAGLSDEMADEVADVLRGEPTIFE